MNKINLRKELLDRLQSIPQETMKYAGKTAWSLLFAHKLWHNCNAVLAYSPLATELDSTELLQRTLSSGRPLFLPRIYESRMNFHRVYDLDTQEKHPWGFNQPRAEMPIFDPRKFKNSLLIAPAVAVNNQGYRLGRGGGFYDIYLAHQPGTQINTIVSTLTQFTIGFEPEPFDIPFHFILTEKSLQEVS